MKEQRQSRNAVPDCTTGAGESEALLNIQRLDSSAARHQSGRKHWNNENPTIVSELRARCEFAANGAAPVRSGCPDRPAGRASEQVTYSHVYAAMKKIRKQLLDIEGQLVDGKKLLKEEKKRVKKAKSKLEKENKKRCVESLEKAVENIADHRDLLENKAVSTSSLQGK
jgi:peptidoglycan hydrolase CwlO-like protein